MAKEISQEMTVEDALNSLINDYTTFKQNMLMQMRKGVVSKDEFLRDVAKHLAEHYGHLSSQVIIQALELFEQYIFGYFRLTKLIEDPEITDIRCLGFNNIAIKERGKRKRSNIKFNNCEEYANFVNFVATKNEVNISNLNAIQRFTDYESNPDFILRFTVIMPLLNTYGEPYLCIRKVPKNFPEMGDLVEKGMMTRDIADMLVERFRSGSTLICGGNSSGKTTILNALKETLPEDMSVLVIQQADELTGKRHPDTMFVHSLPKTGESIVYYDLKDISIAGLTMDVDFFIIGEVKGDEAAYLLNAAYTGQLCAATIHAPSADKGISKAVDYAMYISRYSREEMEKMMACFKTVIFMRGFKVSQIYGVTGWDERTKSIVYEKIFEREE